jgi:hypothetical protein
MGLVRDHAKDDPPEREMLELLRTAPTISRDEKGRVTGADWTKEEKTTLEGSTKDWLKKTLEKDSRYNDAVMSVSSLWDSDDDFVRECLISFLDKSLTNPSREDIEILLDDLQGEPSKWEVSVQVAGIGFEGEARLDENMVLREIRGSDLSVEYLPNVDPVSKMPGLVPNCVVEFEMLSKRFDAILEMTERICTTLSLFKETCAHWVNLGVSPRSFSQFPLPFGHKLTFRSSRTTQDPYASILDDEIGDLRRFVTNFLQKIPRGFLSGKPDTPLEIALRRYLDSIRETSPTEQRLTLAVMGLEALFLEERQELSFRLRVRSATALGNLNEDPLAVYEQVSKAYGFRSNYVHGSIVATDDIPLAQEVLTDVWRYLRKAIVFYIATGIGVGEKSKFLLRLDRSLIVDSERLALAKEFELVSPQLKGAV